MSVTVFTGLLPSVGNFQLAFILQVAGAPGTIGCIDGFYIAIECPANKIRLTYVNRHHYLSLTREAICDRNKRFLDITPGHPSKVHDARVFRTSSTAGKLSQICRRASTTSWVTRPIL